jgi:hypothetical protein
MGVLKMRVYLAGKMRNAPHFNFPQFHKYAKQLRAAGHEVFSPAEHDIARHGKDISKGNKTGSNEQAEKEHRFDLRTALGEDLAWICAEAEAVALIPGWETSKGVAAEKATAEALGLEIIYLGAKPTKKVDLRHCWPPGKSSNTVIAFPRKKKGTAA